MNKAEHLTKFAKLYQSLATSYEKQAQYLDTIQKLQARIEQQSHQLQKLENVISELKQQASIKEIQKQLPDDHQLPDDLTLKQQPSQND